MVVRSLDTLGQAFHVRLQLQAHCRNYLCRHDWPVDLEYVMGFVGADHRLTPVRGVKHFSERMKCPICGWIGVTIVRGAAMRQTALFGSEHELFLSVEQWDDRDVQLEKLIARVGNLEVGWAAYRSAAEIFAGKRIQMLDHRRVMADSTLTIIDGGKRPWRS